jgi:hypothetical protein
MEMDFTRRQSRALVQLVVCAILFLTTANTIRSLPTDKSQILNELYTLTKETTHQINFPIDGAKTKKHIDEGSKMKDFEENNNNMDEEEDCLIRCTLASHVDYIYTQQHNP